MDTNRRLRALRDEIDHHGMPPAVVQTVDTASVASRHAFAALSRGFANLMRDVQAHPILALLIAAHCGLTIALIRRR